AMARVHPRPRVPYGNEDALRTRAPAQRRGSHRDRPALRTGRARISNQVLDRPSDEIRIQGAERKILVEDGLEHDAARGEGLQRQDLAHDVVELHVRSPRLHVAESLVFVDDAVNAFALLQDEREKRTLLGERLSAG